MCVWLYQNSFGQALSHVKLGLVKGRPEPITPAVEWLDSLIRPGGLLLVVFHLFAISILVLWVGLRNKNKR